MTFLMSQEELQSEVLPFLVELEMSGVQLAGILLHRLLHKCQI